LSASVRGSTLFASCGSLTTSSGPWVRVDTVDRSVTAFDWDVSQFRFVRHHGGWSNGST
jgi:hypothetical protein